MTRALAAALAALLAIPGLAAAQSRRPAAALAWQVPADDASCPGAAWFRAEVAARIGYDPFVDASPDTVTVTVAGAGARRGVRVEVRDAEGRTVGARTLTSRTGGCRELLASAALSLQLVFDPSGPLASRPPPPPDPSPPLPPPAPAPPPAATPRTPRPAPPPATPPPRPVRGVELTARFAYGAFQDQGPGAWIATLPAGSPLVGVCDGFGFDAAAGLRVVPQVSFGLRGAYLSLSTGAASDAARAWSVGAYARVYLTPGTRRGAIDPWLGVGFDFAARVVRGSRAPTGVVTEWSLGAVALPLSAGFDVHVASGLALGLWGSASLWFPHELCSGPATSFCFVEASGSLGLPVRFERNVAWQGGAAVRYTVPW